MAATLMGTVFEAQLVLHLNHRELAELTGSSLRTVQRWSAGRSSPSLDQMKRLIVAVHPHDADIAGRLAACMGQTLASLGVVAPPAPAQLVTAPPAVERAALLPVLVESVVAAAAEALDVSPRVARPAVLAAMERARAAALTVDDLLAALQPSAPATRAPS
jgi:hypothetical protein